jgi:D-alanyl-D-alanine carboxypeptidase
MMRLFTLVAVLLAAGCSTSAADSQQQSRQTGSLQTDTSALVTAGASSAVARQVNHGVITDAVAGTTIVGQNIPVDPGTHYRTGSITKTMMATVILQLVGEGRLSLDDTVERWLPGVVTGNGNNGATITVRQLLQHTSGLFNYTSDAGFLTTLTTANGFYANKDHQYTPQDLLNIALSHPPVFTPGTAFQYDNTGYIVAGMVIQAVTGNTWDVELTNRIITPLGLTGTSVPGSVETLPAPFAHGYNLWSAGAYSDTTEDNMSWADSAGAVITTTADEAKFWAALLTGGLLAPAQLTAMTTPVVLSTKTGYGLGIGRSTICKQDLWWHEGGTVGYRTLAISTRDAANTVVYDFSTTSLTNGDPAFTTNTNNAQDRLVRDRFCATSSSDSIIAQENIVGGGTVIRLR